MHACTRSELEWVCGVAYTEKMVEEGRRCVMEQEKKDDIMRVDHEQLAQRELPSLLKLRRGSLVQDCGTLS